MLKKNNFLKYKSFTLVELIVSLALFSFIITIVIVASISIVNAQRRVQEGLFLTQTANTILESMSRNLRYSYAYSGISRTSYNGTIYINTGTVSTTLNEGYSASSTQLLTNVTNSPFVVFEKQGGNPTILTDQNAYCFQNNKLYYVKTFLIETSGNRYYAQCDTGNAMLPENINLDYINFDVFGDDALNPRNPMVRIRIRLSHPGGGSIEVQTTLTQRVIQYL